MKAITIKLPETVEIPEYELKLFLASKLYEVGKLSLGQAAKAKARGFRTFECFRIIIFLLLGKLNFRKINKCYLPI